MIENGGFGARNGRVPSIVIENILFKNKVGNTVNIQPDRVANSVSVPIIYNDVSAENYIAGAMPLRLTFPV